MEVYVMTKQDYVSVHLDLKEPRVKLNVVPIDMVGIVKIVVAFNNPAHACSNKQFCLPDPYGCTCVSGFKGISCQTECSPGTFGADCAQTCHCKRECCDRYTGRCTSIEDSSCAFPWTGSNCQKCQPQLYGENCDMECKACNECHRLTGKCITCAPNYLEPDCEIGIINTTFTSANNGQSTTSTCKVYQTGAYEVQTMIIMMNNGVTENFTTSLEAKQDGQNIIIYTFSVTADVDSTYKCVISHEGVLAQSVIIPEIMGLPFYTGSLAILNITRSSISIEWTAWKTNRPTDDRDGPVVGYFLYHKLINNEDWKKEYLNVSSGTVTGLKWDTEYSFAVSAVRAGEGGEGPIGEKELLTKTLCGIPLPVQTVEHQLLTNGNVKVSWRRNLDVESLKCSSNTLIYNIYLKVINNKGYREDVYHTIKNQLTIDNIGVADSYVIYVTISNKDSESISVRSSIEQDIGSANSSISVAIIGGAVAAGVFIGIVFTIMITQCKQKLRKNVTKHDNHESNGQNVYKNYATSDEHVYQDFESNEKVYQNSATTNESVSRAKLHINASKSADEMSVEFHVYQNYEIKDNDSGNPSCNFENGDEPRDHSYESVVLN
ncbi:uncharacterized protein [Antedon mediterranea]|uniref:uncharacterized protein isoform X2 n=1 Tax=Antedon mediterranea TaxID=105859 RepID=UPI003AF86C0A